MNDDDYQRAGGSEADGMDDDDDWEYRPMTMVFYSRMYWLWYVQAVGYVAVMILYFTLKGKEIAFAIYIPVDFLVFLGMAAYYVYQWK